MSGFSAFFLNLSKSGNILFRSMSNGNFLFGSASIVIGRYLGDNSLVHELRVMAAVELHVCKCNICPTFCIKISLWKNPTSNWWQVSYFYSIGQCLNQHRVFEIGKNPNMGGGWLRIQNFQGYSRNSMQHFQGLIKNNVEFSSETKKNSL